MSETITVSLPRFKGPLDLLLSLVRQHEMPITDISIAEITRQYLDYLQRAKEVNLDLGGDFAYMAATLILIKSRSLLPHDPSLDLDEPDPREELVRELLDYDKIRRAAEFLERRLACVGATWSPPPEAAAAGLDLESQLATDSLPPTLNLFQLLEMAKRALELAKARRVLSMDRPAVTIEEMTEWLIDTLQRAGQQRPMPGERLLAQQDSPERKIVLFLTMLELSRAGRLRIQQDRQFAGFTLCLMRPTVKGIRQSTAHEDF